MSYLILRLLDTPENRELKIRAEGEAKRRGFKGVSALLAEALTKELNGQKPQ